ncbi:MAG: helix-turn-helix domain-containing protein [Clostridia bacterium]|nr:helix-turn-helix domain-containing protein [Clostridia bacterium]
MEVEKITRTTLTMKETAEYLGVSYWLVTQLVKRKQIPCSRVGGKVLFRKEALDNYLKQKEEASTTNE